MLHFRRGKSRRKYRKLENQQIAIQLCYLEKGGKCAKNDLKKSCKQLPLEKGDEVEVKCRAGDCSAS